MQGLGGLQPGPGLAARHDLRQLLHLAALHLHVHHSLSHSFLEQFHTKNSTCSARTATCIHFYCTLVQVARSGRKAMDLLVCQLLVILNSSLHARKSQICKTLANESLRTPHSSACGTSAAHRFTPSRRACMLNDRTVQNKISVGKFMSICGVSKAAMQPRGDYGRLGASQLDRTRTKNPLGMLRKSMRRALSSTRVPATQHFS